MSQVNESKQYTKAELDNHANQLNPCHPAYYWARGDKTERGLSEAIKKAEEARQKASKR